MTVSLKDAISRLESGETLIVTLPKEKNRVLKPVYHLSRGGAGFTHYLSEAQKGSNSNLYGIV